MLSPVWLVFALPAAVLPACAVADANVMGEEIVILGDTPTNSGLTISPILQTNPVDPATAYLPDKAALQPASISKDGSADDSAQISDDLWQRIRDGYAMPELQSQYTATHESWYAARPDYVKRMIARSQKYLYHIVEEVQKRGMPTEIALLPMVESAFNPQAYSRSSASGIWQFMPATGKTFGLKQTWWVDNRRDVTEATDAALNYLQKLHVMFGTWDLALAAYNAGEGTVQKAIDYNRRRGLPTDYESLPLPPETKNYVPKLQAVKNIVTHPELYGLDIQTIPNRPYFTKVTAPQQIDAKLAAQLAEISFEEFSSLNPEYNRPVLTATGSAHELLLPISAAQVFTNNLADYDKPLVSWQTYHAKRGERVESIARKFGISMAQLRDVNDLSSRNKITSSGALLVPNGSNDDNHIIAIADHSDAMSAASSASQNDENKSNIRHVVKNHESLQSIATRYGVSSRQLIALNHLKNDRVRTGQRLVITAPAVNKSRMRTVLANSIKSGKTVSKRKIHYVAKHGDNLSRNVIKFDVAKDDSQP